MSLEDIKELQKVLNDFIEGKIAVSKVSVSVDNLDTTPFVSNDSGLLFKIPLVAKYTSGKLEILDGLIPESCKDGKTIICDMIEEPLADYIILALKLLLSEKKNTSLSLSYTFYKKIFNRDYTSESIKLFSLVGISKKDIAYFENLDKCDSDVRQYILDGNVDIKLALDLNTLSENDRAEFIVRFSGLNLSFQYQREFLEWLPEIAFVKQTTVSDILSNTDIINVMSDKKKNPPQKISAIRKILYRMRFPKYSGAVSTWNKAATKLSDIDENIVVKGDPFFEDENLKITINAKDLTGLKRTLNNMSAIDDVVWESLFNPFGTN